MVSALQSRRRKNASLECDVRLMADCASVVPREAFHDSPAMLFLEILLAKRGQDYVVCFRRRPRSGAYTLREVIVLQSLLSLCFLPYLFLFLPSHLRPSSGYCPESASIFAHAIPIGTLGWTLGQCSPFLVISLGGPVCPIFERFASVHSGLILTSTRSVREVRVRHRFIIRT